MFESGSQIPVFGKDDDDFDYSKGPAEIAVLPDLKFPAIEDESCELKPGCNRHAYFSCEKCIKVNGTVLFEGCGKYLCD